MSTAITPECAAGTAPPRKPLAVIAGPTASGKSDLAVRLALAHGNAVVINADSAQVYADLEVLSARPSAGEMCGVPHRLFGAWDGAQPCSAADWAAAARTEIAMAHAAGRLPILVGGTGLYLRTLLDGIAPVPAIDPAIRQQVRALEPAEAFAALGAEDPLRAAVLHPNDRQRIARALEVVRSTGRSLASWQQADTGGIGNDIALHAAILLPDLADLRLRTETRFIRMLDSGAVEEVRALLARGLSPALPVMRAIGVPEIAGWLGGGWSRDEAIARGQRATWQYVRRQLTWLRNQSAHDWKRWDREPFDEREIFASLLQ